MIYDHWSVIIFKCKKIIKDFNILSVQVAQRCRDRQEQEGLWAQEGGLRRRGPHHGEFNLGKIAEYISLPLYALSRVS